MGLQPHQAGCACGRDKKVPAHVTMMLYRPGVNMLRLEAPCLRRRIDNSEMQYLLQTSTASWKMR